MVRLLAVAVGSLGYAIYDPSFTESIQVSVPLFCGGLFLCCLFCHGELAKRRPAPRDLTSFYLMISLGGALGAIFVGLLAPVVFDGVYEFPLTLCLTALLARRSSYGRKDGWRASSGRFATLCMAVVLVYHAHAYKKDSIFDGPQFLRWPSRGAAPRLAQAAVPHALSRQDRARRAISGSAEEPSGHDLLRARIPASEWPWTISAEHQNA